MGQVDSFGVRADGTESQIIGRLKSDGGDSIRVRADGTESQIIGRLKPDGGDSIRVQGCSGLLYPPDPSSCFKSMPSPFYCFMGTHVGTSLGTTKRR
jgi:hypothetical protein